MGKVYWERHTAGVSHSNAWLCSIIFFSLPHTPCLYHSFSIFHTCKTFANFQASARLFFIVIRIRVNSRKNVFRIKNNVSCTKHYLCEEVRMNVRLCHNREKKRGTMLNKQIDNWISYPFHGSVSPLFGI